MNFKRIGPLAVALSPALLLLEAAPQDQQRLRFEVESIKRNKSGDLATAVRSLPAQGSYSAENHTVKQLIRQAYGLKDFQVKGGPGWIDDFSPEKFDVTAKTSTPATKEQIMIMLQQMLEDRFALKYRYETREMDIYRLVVAVKGALGPQMRRPEPSDVAHSPVRGPLSDLIGQNATMGDLAEYLSGIDQRMVIDQTGLSNHYDFNLQSAAGADDPRRRLVGLKLELPPDSRPALPQALREQLGLKLESAKAPVKIMVVEGVGRPTEN